jgi:HSP20 family protein
MTAFSLKPASQPRYTNLFGNLWHEDFPGFLKNDVYRFSPSVNIKDTAAAYLIEVAVPGFKKEDFSVKVEENLLTISGKVETAETKEDGKYTRKEFTQQSFSRSFTLPKNLKAEEIAATYDQGILTLSLPKPEEEKAKGAIEVKIA